MKKYIVYPVLALCICALCSCGRYQRKGDRPGEMEMWMDKDRTHRYEEGQQRRIDEDKQRRMELDRRGESVPGSIRYFLY